MDRDFETGRRRLPGYDDRTADAERARSTRSHRDDGVRRGRRASNWTAAALVAGVAVTSGYFAHAATVASPPVTGNSGTSGQVQPGTAAHGHKAGLTHPVATSGGSGVTAGGGAGGGSGGAAAGWRDN